MADTQALARTQGNAPAPQAASRGNFVSVTEEVGRISPFHVFRRREVTLSPRPDDGDVYSAGFLGKSGKGRDAENNCALAKNGILKLARAAGINIVVDKCRPIVFDRDRIVYESVVSWRGVDGTLREAKGSVEIDLAPDSPEMVALREECNTIREWDKRENGYVNRPANPQQAEAKFKSEVGRLKKFMLPMAESKSLNRAIRNILQLKQKYTAAEIAKPWIVEVVEYSPNLEDADVRASVLQSGAQAAQALYGTSPQQPALPAPAAPQVAPEEVAEDWTAAVSDDEGPDWDRETGEIIQRGEQTEEAEVEEAEELPQGEAATRSFLEDIASADSLGVLEDIGAAIKSCEGLSKAQLGRLTTGFRAARERLAK